LLKQALQAEFGPNAARGEYWTPIPSIERLNVFTAQVLAGWYVAVQQSREFLEIEMSGQQILAAEIDDRAMLVFAVLAVGFDNEQAVVADLKDRYRRGGFGDSVVKERLDNVLQALLAPIRERRRALARDPGYVISIVKEGTLRSRELTNSTLKEVRAALGLFMLE